MGLKEGDCTDESMPIIYPDELELDLKVIKSLHFNH